MTSGSLSGINGGQRQGDLAGTVVDPGKCAFVGAADASSPVEWMLQE